MLWSTTTWTSQYAISHLFLHLKDIVATVDYYETFESRASRRLQLLQLSRILLLELFRCHFACTIRSELCPHLGLDLHVSRNLIILAIGQPTEAIEDLAVPRRRVFPCNFLDILDRVKCEVYVNASACASWLRPCQAGVSRIETVASAATKGKVECRWLILKCRVGAESFHVREGLSARVSQLLSLFLPTHWGFCCREVVLRLRLAFLTRVVKYGEGQVQVDRSCHGLRKELLYRRLRLIWLKLRLFIVYDLSQLVVVLELSLVLAWNWKLQVLDWNLKASPQSILNAVDRARCENFKFYVLCKRVLSHAASEVRVWRIHFLFWLTLLLIDAQRTDLE